MKDGEMGEEDTLRPEYDLTDLRVRRLGPDRQRFGDVIRLDPDVAAVFPDAGAVNEALRFLIRITRDRDIGLRVRDGD
ncbi:MAG: hypothetical protein IT332_07920 [Ardenticatenales bacterium]|nr:hypothetical protein [Ardenticatenales bacterium]